jgi:signal transduction histidine kinase
LVVDALPVLLVFSVAAGAGMLPTERFPTASIVAFSGGYVFVSLHAALRPLANVRHSAGQWLHSGCFVLNALIAGARGMEALHLLPLPFDRLQLIKIHVFVWMGVTPLLLVGCLLLCHELALRRLQLGINRIDEINSNLQRRIEEETSKCQQQQQLLARQSRHAAMGEMLGAVAHQWRQPLSAVGLIIQSLVKAYRRNLLNDDFVHQAEQDARRQILYMSETIDTFRSFFQAKQGRIAFAPETIMREVVAFVEPQFSSCDIIIKVVGSLPASTMVCGRPDEFKQVLMNLFANARDAIVSCGDGADTGEKGTIILRLRKDIDSLCLEVEDNGTGIPVAVLPSVFDPYFTTRQDSGGTGIGLYLCRMIIEESMGGHLSCENTLQGALFRICLPEGDCG